MIHDFFQDPAGNYVRPKIEDNGDGTYTVSYTPEDVGRYSVAVRFGGQLVPGAPFSVMTSPTGDASKVKIAGKFCVLQLLTNRNFCFLVCKVDMHMFEINFTKF